MNKLPALTGWVWLRRGFALFRQQPGLLTMVAIAHVLATILFMAFPLIGPVIAIVVAPALNMAIMQSCALIERGERVTPAVLLTGFRKPHSATLIKLGLLQLGLATLLVVILMLSLSDDFMQQMRRVLDPAAGRINMAEIMAAIPAGDLLAIRVVGALNIASWVLLYLAAPLVYWKDMKPFKAVFYSVFAVLGAARVYLVLLLAWFGLLFAMMMMIGLVLGKAQLGSVLLLWLVLLFWLILQCAFFAGYRQIFGGEEAPPPAA
jgi:hypothetical protein